MYNSLSIIIPVWNEENIIQKTSRFLKKLRLPFRYSELILVAGGEDNTYNISKKIQFENFDKVLVLMQNTKDFKSGALLKGIKESRGDIITIVDADTILTPNFMIEVVQALKKCDVVNCDFIPILRKGFWYDYYIANKLIWAKNPNYLPSLFGAATISIKKSVFNRIGIENFFTDKTTAGVDYYMGIMFKKNHINIGFVKDTRVFTPRPGNIRDFMRDQSRWFTAFFKINENKKFIIISTLIISILSILFPIIMLLIIFNKLRDLRLKFPKKLKYFSILTTVEYILNLIRIKTILKQLTKRIKFLGHFKGSRY